LEPTRSLLVGWGSAPRRLGLQGMAVVLIVEDEATVLILAESVLQEAGYETVSASTVAEALAIVESRDQQIDLLFTDLGLGDEIEGGLAIGQGLREVSTRRTGALHQWKGRYGRDDGTIRRAARFRSETLHRRSVEDSGREALGLTPPHRIIPRWPRARTLAAAHGLFHADGT
jgi:response regulator receiver domain-containing protein